MLKVEKTKNKSEIANPVREKRDNSKIKSEYLFEVKGISKAFPGVKALDNVSLQLKYGEVLAIVGENGAGKSTMMKILAGIYIPDNGDIYIDGEIVTVGTVEKATQLGIALVHQELNLCDNLSVASNVFLGREPYHGRFIRFLDENRLNTETAKVLEKVGLNVPAVTIVKDLTIGSQQLVEISKALSIDARIVMFDEPTSSLTDHETERLFKVIKDLRSHGVSCIYISHRLGEVKKVADRVVVLRDGKISGSLDKEEISREAMIRLMVGRDIGKLYQKNHIVSDKIRVELHDFIVPKRASAPINLSIHGGEIIVLSGLVGAGRTELLQAVFGVDKSWGGKVSLDGKEVEIDKPLDAIRAGMVLVPEDRKMNGLVIDMEVDNNIALPSLTDRLSRIGFIDREKVNNLADKMVKILDIRLYRTSQLAESLSGGNQQKVVLGKWLSMDPVLLLLDEPTRGIDVSAKLEIYKLLEELAATGVAILVASSEMQEVLGIADRIVVMCEGKIAGELDPEKCNEEDIIKLATESAV